MRTTANVVIYLQSKRPVQRHIRGYGYVYVYGFDCYAVRLSGVLVRVGVTHVLTHRYRRQAITAGIRPVSERVYRQVLRNKAFVKYKKVCVLR